MSSDLVSASAPQISRRMLGLAGGVALFTPAILFLPLHEARAQARSAYDLISSAPAVSGFAQIIKTHGMEEAFQAPGEFGFFVPVNTALERTSPMQLERFRTDKEFARQIILNHITDYDGLVSAFIGQGTGTTTQVKTKAGKSLTLTTGVGVPSIGGQPITYANIPASNGRCHAIDGVLMA
ncbi:fasciclin domain-containing protein [Teichococcus oryzae]|uniref:Fasciclin domain-containing protein n=1 Tax=Teichococcus oryzae TaxID=1608942 RepID=A0A5B2TBQ6_9PROT|nr:fasciclin domain-containing protein [Pseudoroseomonas oryzae]KAA2211220.1 fasciclin domain-containing protein [Pseudoroseomonas oryzae]